MIAEVIVKVDHPTLGDLYKKNRYEWQEGTFEEALARYKETGEGFDRIEFVEKATKDQFEEQNK